MGRGFCITVQKIRSTAAFINCVDLIIQEDHENRNRKLFLPITTTVCSLVLGTKSGVHLGKLGQLMGWVEARFEGDTTLSFHAMAWSNVILQHRRYHIVSASKLLRIRRSKIGISLSPECANRVQDTTQFEVVGRLPVGSTESGY